MEKIIEQTLKFCQSKLPKEEKKDEEKEKKEDAKVEMEGLTLLTKKEDRDEFYFAPTKKKAAKAGKKAEDKKDEGGSKPIKHNIETVSLFNKLKIDPPLTTDDLPATIEKLEQKLKEQHEYGARIAEIEAQQERQPSKKAQRRQNKRLARIFHAPQVPVPNAGDKTTAGSINERVERVMQPLPSVNQAPSPPSDSPPHSAAESSTGGEGVESIELLRQKTKGVFMEASQDGSLQSLLSAFAAAEEKPEKESEEVAGVEDENKLRSQVRQTLAKATRDGSLVKSLEKVRGRPQSQEAITTEAVSQADLSSSSVEALRATTRIQAEREAEANQQEVVTGPRVIPEEQVPQEQVPVIQPVTKTVEDPQIPIIEQTLQHQQCPAGHLLVSRYAKLASICATCTVETSRGCQLWSCQECDFDVCHTCSAVSDTAAPDSSVGPQAPSPSSGRKEDEEVEKDEEAAAKASGPKQCPAGHLLASRYEKLAWICATCTVESSGGCTLWSCQECDFDVCRTCSAVSDTAAPDSSVGPQAPSPSSGRKEDEEVDKDEEAAAKAAEEDASMQKEASMKPKESGTPRKGKKKTRSGSDSPYTLPMPGQEYFDDQEDLSPRAQSARRRRARAALRKRAQEMGEDVSVLESGSDDDASPTDAVEASADAEGAFGMGMDDGMEDEEENGEDPDANEESESEDEGDESDEEEERSLGAAQESVRSGHGRGRLSGASSHRASSLVSMPLADGSSPRVLNSPASPGKRTAWGSPSANQPMSVQKSDTASTCDEASTCTPTASHNVWWVVRRTFIELPEDEDTGIQRRRASSAPPAARCF